MAAGRKRAHMPRSTPHKIATEKEQTAARKMMQTTVSPWGGFTKTGGIGVKKKVAWQCISRIYFTHDHFVNSFHCVYVYIKRELSHRLFPTCSIT